MSWKEKGTGGGRAKGRGTKEGRRDPSINPRAVFQVRTGVMRDLVKRAKEFGSEFRLSAKAFPGAKFIAVFKIPPHELNRRTEIRQKILEHRVGREYDVIFQDGVRALSYYDAVLQSQRRRPDQLLTCAVLTTPEDAGIVTKEQKTLKSSRDHAKRRRILIGASETLELFPRFYDDDRYREGTGYSGAILANYTVPKRIPSRPRTASSRKCTNH